ncbi:kinesin-like protein KIN-14R [Salvia miltiorrhiza]|uniref:kinesin-like protein KIN-14R n=1 Tax=Salvia miltiorrhiza TaxID=226208 RepID=UPI0025AD3151|nr:kinesin-like protein KIN-14R [Salvia miltiorrhiza]
MEQNYDFKPFNDNPEIRISSSGFGWEQVKNSNQETGASAMEEDEKEESVADLMVWDSGARLIPSGFTDPCPTEEIVLFVNAGSMTSRESDSGVEFAADNFFEGGDIILTEDFILEGGDCSFIYQSARLGNFCYRFENLMAGDYFIDLHFSEIINVSGPKGMRVFNVFIQDEKILSEFDIFSIVGFNKPLQVVGARAAVKDDGILHLRFEGVFGSPILSGICVRRAPKSSVPQPTRDYFICTNCSTQIEYPSPQKKALRTKSVAKYEKDIQDLKDTLKKKTDECYQSWMSWSAANEQLQKVRMDLDNKTFQTYSLDQTLEKQAEKLRDLASKYEHDQKSWTEAIANFEQKVKIMKQEHSELSREAHECVDSIPDLNKMVFAVQALVEQCEDLKVKYNDEQMKRRKLHNQLQETKGNIRVFCRCRPLSKSEVIAGCASVMDFDAAKDGDLGIVVNGSTKKIFKFDRVYTPKDDQVDVFADAAPMVVSVLDGYNVCIFAYGQTGTGKTFTMEGTEANRGVNYRTLEELFKTANERTETNTYSISVSVLEVYNEQIRDLLAIETSKKLEIKQASEGSHHIPGIVEAKVENIQQVWNVLQAGSSARAVGSNNVNEHSSRSHCMLCITVRSKNLITGECMKSKLWLVDLAGSERLAKTDVQGDRLKEAQNINRSLSALGDVIFALANKSGHVPYRNSKLTHLLQDSLGGDSKTLMFVQISPSDQDSSETLSSLNFATRVRGVELGPARKQVDTNELQRMKTMLDKARQECKSKDETLKRLEENLHNLESKTKGKDQFYKNQLEKLKELEGQVELKASLHCQSEKQVSHLSEKLKGREESCSKLQQKVVELENKLKQQDESHSTTYQKKVNDLEKKLTEQMQQSESTCQTLEHKVKELQRKLTEQEENEECLSLRQKIKELEDKLREQEQQLASRMISESANQLNSTPVDNKLPVREEMTNEAEHRILRSLNLANRRGSNGSAPVKENGHFHEVKKKRLSRNSEVENNGVPPPVSDHAYKSRRSDPPRPAAAAGASRATKPSVTVQRPVARVKTTRDAVQGIKERDSKKRIWTR